MAERYDIGRLFGDDELLELNQLPEGPMVPKSQVIREESFPGWNESLDPNQPDDGEKLKLSSGIADIEVITKRKPNGTVEFKWDAELPKVVQKLRPEDMAGIDKRILEELFPWMFIEMPKRLGFGSLNDIGTDSKYRQSTIVVIGFNGEKDPTHFMFHRNDEMLRFAAHYSGRNQQINWLKIKAGVDENTAADFAVGINYQDSSRSQMSLNLRADQSGIHACKGDVGNWILSTHLRRAVLGDLSVPGTYLSGAMEGIVERTMGKRQR